MASKEPRRPLIDCTLESISLNLSQIYISIVGSYSFLIFLISFGFFFTVEICSSECLVAGAGDCIGTLTGMDSLIVVVGSTGVRALELLVTLVFVPGLDLLHLILLI